MKTQLQGRSLSTTAKRENENDKFVIQVKHILTKVTYPSLENTLTKLYYHYEIFN